MKKHKINIGNIFSEIVGRISPKYLCKFLYQRAMGRKLDFSNPKTYNEWVCWLQFYSDTRLWTTLADKYRVRRWISDKGLGEYLPTLYATFDSVKDINFEKLPNQFVLKSNNGCGDVIIVKDKTKIDRQELKKRLSKMLKSKFGYKSAEPHYVNIKRCIVVEELLGSDQDKPLSDYKWFCFNGEPKFAQVISERDFSQPHAFKLQVYDTTWNSHSEYLNRPHLKNEVKRPELLDTQLELCKILSVGFPQMRVDLYEVNGKVYIGELTLTNAAGRDVDMPYEFDLLLGSFIDPNIITKRHP